MSVHISQELPIHGATLLPVFFWHDPLFHLRTIESRNHAWFWQQTNAPANVQPGFHIVEEQSFWKFWARQPHRSILRKGAHVSAEDLCAFGAKLDGSPYCRWGLQNLLRTGDAMQRKKSSALWYDVWAG